MTRVDNDLRVRPGRIRDRGRGAARPKSFVGEVMRAAKKAGHTGSGFGRKGANTGTRFGRGRSAALALSLRSPSRRVMMKARVIRHRGSGFRSAPLAKHMSYLRREGVTRDGADARMFEARSDVADERAFAERCADDRHHFRFIVSPEDSPDMENLRGFTRELMADAERDLPRLRTRDVFRQRGHVGIVERLGIGADDAAEARAGHGQDLVISRDYISRGFRARAEERVTVELGPRSEQEIRSTLEKEVDADRWTGLDRALRNAVDEGAGVADLRPGNPDDDPELRRLMTGRVTKLERLGLADQVAPGCWTLKPGIEEALRDLSTRGDIVKTMHRAIVNLGRQPDVSGFALHGENVADPVLGRLVARGLHDELKGSAYAIVEGVDGRTHHLRFSDLEMTGDAAPGAIVEARTYEDANGRKRLSLAIRSDLSLQEQIAARGRHGSTASFSRANQPRPAAGSAQRCATPSSAAQIIWPLKGSRAGRDSD